MEGGEGTHTSSQISAPIIRDGIFLHANNSFEPNGTEQSPTVTLTHSSKHGVKCLIS